MLIKAVAPCKGCDRRELGCHSRCADYLAFREKRDEMLQKRAEESTARPQQTAWIRNNIKRMERWR